MRRNSLRDSVGRPRLVSERGVRGPPVAKVVVWRFVGPEAGPAIEVAAGAGVAGKGGTGGAVATAAEAREREEVARRSDGCRP